MSTGDDEEATSLRHVRPAEEVNPAEQIAAAVLQTDDVTVVGNVEVQSNTEKLKSPRKSLKLPRLSGLSLPENRPSIVNVVVAEVATFHDVFGVLGVPTIVVLVLSAVWTFMLAVIQVHADSMANIMMNTTDFDNGEFWLLPQPDTGLVVSSVVLLSLFGIGYAGLAVMMIFYYRAGSAHKDSSTPSDMSTEAKMVKLSASEKERNSLKRFIAWIRHKLDLPTDVRQHYFTAALDLPKLIFQTITLFTYLRAGFPTAIIYYYSVLLLCNWLMACYRSQRYVADPDLIIARLYYAFDLFFAVFAPLVVLIYFITSFQFDRGAFMTRLETIGPGTFDTVARIFGDPSEISSFCNAFHYLQFSSGSTLFYKSALNVLSLYKWRKIILTLIHNHHERQVERNRKALVEPAVTNLSRSASIRMAITRKIEAVSKPKLGKHFVPKLFLSLVFLAAGIVNFVYSIGSVRSTINLCSKYDKCVVKSYQWNFGEEHCTCLVFADRQVKPTTYAEWIDPVDTTTNLAQLSIAGELRIVQIINRAVPELPEELRECHELEQLILAYTKTKSLPEWISEFSHLQYIHIEGDFTSRRLKTIPDGAFDNMPHLMFLHLGGIPNVEKLPSLSGLKSLRYLAMAVLDSLQEIPSFEGLSQVTDLMIVHALQVTTLPSFDPLESLSSLSIRARSAVCCNGYIKGTCNMTESQCLPIAGEKHPLSCTDERAPAKDVALFESFGSSICPSAKPLDREATSPSKYSTDELCGGVNYKECKLNGVQGICYNIRMMVVECVADAAYISMRKLQIQRNVGDPCNAEVEAWLGCK